MPRLDAILKLLEKSPNDAELLYAIAMEHKKSGDTTRAVEWFDRTIAADDAFCYAYFHRGQTLEDAEDIEAAKASYERGIDVATRVNNAKALGELRGARDALGN